MKVLNLISGPGYGKSTLASKLFVDLKCQHKKVELVTEFAKDLVYEDRNQALINQIYVFGNQLQRLKRLEGKIDIAIVDSPLILSCIYGRGLVPESFNKLALDVFNSFNNYNFCLKKQTSFQSYGRIHNETESNQRHEEILQFMVDCKLPFYIIDPTSEIEQQGILEIINET